MIKLRNATFAYGKAAPVLAGIDLDLPAGRLLVLAGANGNGKSTLLCLLAGILVPDSGTVRVGSATAPEAIRRLARLVVQDADLQILGGTVEEDLLLGFDPEDPAAREHMLAMVRRLGLETKQDAPVHTLSWGQKRRLCLAGALLARPQVLLLDEPFSGLDYPGGREMRRILAENRRDGLTQVVAAHDLEPLADLADIVAVVHGGGLPLCGQPSEVIPHLPRFEVRQPRAWRSGTGPGGPDAYDW